MILLQGMLSDQDLHLLNIGIRSKVFRKHLCRYGILAAKDNKSSVFPKKIIKLTEGRSYENLRQIDIKRAVDHCNCNYINYKDYFVGQVRKKAPDLFRCLFRRDVGVVSPKFVAYSSVRVFSG